MHFVFISTLYNPPWGGCEVLWSTAAMRALEQGHRVSVFVSERGKLESPLVQLKEGGAKLHFWKPKYSPLNFFQRVRKKLLCQGLPEWEWWHGNLRQDADVICLNQGGALCGPIRHGLTEVIQATGKPYVVLARADTGFEFLTDRTRPHVRQFFEGAQAFVSASQSAIDLLRLYLPSKLTKAQVLHSPLADYGGEVAVPPLADGGGLMAEDSKLVPSSATGRPVDSPPATSDSRPVTAPEVPLLDARRSTLDQSEVVDMACVGRLKIGDKGQHLLLDCLAEKTWRSRPFRLSFYGEGPDRKYLEELVDFYELGEKVIFAGYTSDVAGIWKKSHLAVQPSFVEGAPQSLLESMLCRRPCVATAVSGIPEWVEERKTGFLAQAPTVHHLRLALERAWESRHCWPAMGEAARAACLSKRDPDPAGTLLGLLNAAAKA